MTDITRDFVAAALIGARPLILKMFGPDSSVLSTRLAIAVFEHFGFDATPMPVHVIIANPILVPALNDGRANIFDKATWPKGSYSEMLGWVTGKGGHLVTVSGDVMLDLALDQANRPALGIELSARAFRVTPEFLSGRPMQFDVEHCSLAYTRVTSPEKWWTKHAQWGKRDEYVRRGLAGDVIRAAKAKYTSGMTD